jgi:L-ascorbate metabolism protein UlaG (beta-lactamase superfamily)
MIVTKYPQSCLLLEHKNKKIIIDPGSFVAETYKPEIFGRIDLVLITHEHFDHINTEFLQKICGLYKPEVWANSSTAKLIPSLVTTEIKEDSNFYWGEINIKTINIPHMMLPNGQPGPDNTAYIIDDILFHPGDGIGSPNSKVEIFAAPLAGPDMSPKKAVDYIKLVNPKVVIPIHYDFWPAKPEMWSGLIEPLCEYRYLKNGESLNLEK